MYEMHLALFLKARCDTCGGLLAGHDLILSVISRHHFEWLGSNEVPGSDTN
jgi:hypothetical protein